MRVPPPPTEAMNTMKLRLKTPADVRRSLAKITNMIVNDEIEARQANAAIYACSTILSAIRTDDLEAKVRELEVLLREND